MDKKIELELRAEISTQNRELFQNRLVNAGVLHSHTKRLSVMYFGKIGTKKLDIRVRVTNGECEVVVKSGSFGAHDRIEIAQKIKPEEFLGMIKIFTQFGFTIEVGERETFNYTLPDDIIVSLVSAGPISYIELEKMSSKADVEKNNKLLNQWAERLELQLLKSENEFDILCRRLAEKVDWPFHGTNEEYIKLNKLFNCYLKSG
jgi:adenylate cyclase class IV